MRLVRIEPGEQRAVLVAMLYFFCLFTAYFMLRPVRETMGITGGVRNLQWLFSATFVVMLAAMPVFGALSARFRRCRRWEVGGFNMLKYAPWMLMCLNLRALRSKPRVFLRR